MRPGFRCTLYDGRTMRITGTRTYEQQKNAQDEQRRHFCTEGALLLTYGLAGLGAVSASYRPWRLPWRRRS